MDTFPENTLMPIISKESELKESFRVFSKDDEGCITAEELKFVMTHLPGKVGGEKEQTIELSY